MLGGRLPHSLCWPMTTWLYLYWDTQNWLYLNNHESILHKKCVVISCGPGWCFIIYSTVYLHVASQPKGWGTYVVVYWAWNASCWDRSWGSSVSVVTCNCKAMAMVLLEVGACLSYQGLPYRFAWSRGLKLFGLNFFPLDIELHIVLVPLLWAIILAAARCQMPIEQLLWYSSFIHVSHVARPMKLSLDYLSFMLTKPALLRISWFVILSCQ